MAKKPFHASPSSRFHARVLDRRTLLGGIGGAVAAGSLTARSLPAQHQATPSAGHSPISLPTPIATGPEGLTAVLSCVPDTMLKREDGSGIHWYYADIAQQLEALGLVNDPDAFGQQEMVRPTIALVLASNAHNYAMVEEFTDAIGFQPLGMNQSLLVGDPPTFLTVFRGNLDVTVMRAAWEATGYARETAANGSEYWTIGADGEFEIDHPVQRVMFAAFNNLTILGDDLLVCAPTLALLDEAIATYESGEGSAALDPVLGLSLYTLPDTTVSAMAVTPGLFGPPRVQSQEQREAIDDMLAGSMEEVGAMPPIDGMIVGVLAGAVDPEFLEERGETPDPETGQGIAVVRLAMTSAADAEQALVVVEERWNSMNSVATNEPYAELMEIVSTSVDGNIAEIDFRQVRSPAVWRNMVFQNDLLPFQFDPGD